MTGEQTRGPATGPGSQGPRGVDLGPWLLDADIGPAHVLAALVVAGLLVFYNQVGLYPTDLWSHLAYGQWILDHGSLPVSEPFLPVASGVAVVNYCWLGQVLLAWTERAGGAPWLSNVFALAVAARMGVLLLAYRRAAGSMALALVGALFSYGMVWGRMAVIRPEMFAVIAFNAVLLLVVSIGPDPGPDPTAPAGAGPGRWWWVGLAAVFALWVNLHASVVVGLALLAALAAGRAIDVARSGPVGAGIARRVATDPWLRRWLAAGAVALVASGLHPSGWRVLVQAGRVASNPNLRSVTEWQPVPLATVEGAFFLVSLLLLAATLRLSRRPVRAAEVLLLLPFTLAAAFSARFLQWYAPIYGLVVLPHLASALSGWRGERPVAGRQERAMRSLVCGLLVLVALLAGFIFSYWSDPILGARSRDEQNLYNRRTPLALARYLEANPPRGRLFNSQVLGDWLEWVALEPARREGRPLNLLINSQLHLVPAATFRMYSRIGFVQPGWRRALREGGFAAAAVSKQQHPQLVAELRELAGWRVAYEDEIGIVAIGAEEAAPDGPAAGQPAGGKLAPLAGPEPGAMDPPTRP